MKITIVNSKHTRTSSNDYFVSKNWFLLLVFGKSDTQIQINSKFCTAKSINMCLKDKNSSYTTQNIDFEFTDFAAPNKMLNVYLYIRNLKNSRLKPVFSAQYLYVFAYRQVKNTKWILCSRFLRFMIYKLTFYSKI